MSSALDVSIPLPAGTGEASARRFAEDPAGWLAADARRSGAAWQAEVRLGRVRQPVVATVGTLWVDGPERWRSLTWTPVRIVDGIRLADDRRLPTFTGRISLVTMADSRLQLVLAGTYDPGGRLGSAIDALMLRKVAEITALQLLGDIADRLSRPPLTLTIDERAAHQPTTRS